MKRILEDISATPNAWKKFVSGGDRPEHNSTISTPGHKPPERKVQPLNNTFITPLNR
ncbi:UNVERIFIED_CONTAM: hypothetical protein GTU68_048589 [Idotea baltica]|nr:hypothetical protein [Idotea baltica]